MVEQADIHDTARLGKFLRRSDIIDGRLWITCWMVMGHNNRIKERGGGQVAYLWKLSMDSQGDSKKYH
jgi:IS5 family transposase